MATLVDLIKTKRFPITRRTWYEKRCRQCSQIYDTTRGIQHFCSKTCYQAYRRAKIEKKKEYVFRTCKGCGIKYHPNQYDQKFCNIRCSWTYRRGKKVNHTTPSNNYCKIAIPDTDPYASMRDYFGYVKRCRYVMAQQLGRVLLPSEKIRHKNNILSDDRPENLYIWKTKLQIKLDKAFADGQQSIINQSLVLSNPINVDVINNKINT